MLRLYCVLTLSAVLGFSVPAYGQKAGSLMAKFARATAPRRSIQPVRALLAKRVERVDWTEITFDEVLAWLRSMADDNVNIIPRWNALSNEGVDADSSVTLKLVDTSVAEVLDEVLDQLSEEGQITYHGERNMFRISTKEDFNRKMEIKVYDVTDILFSIPDMGQSAPAIDLSAVSRQSSGSGGSGQSIFSGTSSGQSEELEEDEEDIEERLEELRTMILAVISPETWGGEGGAGGAGSIEFQNARFLVVRNTIEVHEQLGGLFEYSR